MTNISFSDRIPPDPSNSPPITAEVPSSKITQDFLETIKVKITFSSTNKKNILEIFNTEEGSEALLKTLNEMDIRPEHITQAQFDKHID